MTKQNILIIVPAYNEEQNIKRVIEDLNNSNIDIDILIVNDGSSDNTALIVRDLGVKLLDLASNLGIGGAVQSGFKFAKKYNYDIAIQFDGDGQHLASEIYKLINPINNGNADVVIGSRFLKKEGFQSSFTRRIGIKIFEIINKLLIKQKITDNTSGFRAYNKKAISYLFLNYPTDYPEPEAVVMLGKEGFRIKEVSVLMKERQGGESSISGFKPIYYMIKVLLSIFITYIRNTKK